MLSVGKSDRRLVLQVRTMPRAYRPHIFPVQKLFKYGFTLVSRKEPQAWVLDLGTYDKVSRGRRPQKLKLGPAEKRRQRIFSFSDADEYFSLPQQKFF